MAKITISVGISGSKWPNGKPVSTEILPNGEKRHLMEDGRVMTVGQPTYRLEYLSTWVGAEPGETYPVNIAISGLSEVTGFYITWNFDIDELRNYAFHKTVSITHLETGESFTGEELCASLGGEMLPKRD